MSTLDPNIFGVGMSGLTDLLAVDAVITDPAQLIGQRIAHRLTTPRGALAIINGPADFGWDLYQLVNRKLAPNDIASAQAQIAAECSKDEEVSTAAVTITASAGNVSVKIALSTAAGPFTLTFNLTTIGAAAATQAIFTR